MPEAERAAREAFQRDAGVKEQKQGKFERVLERTSARMGQEWVVCKGHRAIGLEARTGVALDMCWSYESIERLGCLCAAVPCGLVTTDYKDGHAC